MRSWTALLLLTACTEPLVLSDDLSTQAMPVGVRTVTHQGVTLEVWYPATGDAREEPGEPIDLAGFLTPEFVERAPEIQPPSLPTRAFRDAEPRRLDEALPLVLFSHGFGGFRTQSVDLTTHLAARGYVVIAADHPGRMLQDVLPCLLSPPAGTCALGIPGAGDDPGPEGLAAALDWAGSADDGLIGAVDTSLVGVFGHSAGGASTVTFANTETAVTAALPMAGAGTFERDLPSAIIGGSCDATIPETRLAPSGDSASEGYTSLTAAGHLAFSDLCAADLGTLGDQIAARDDANPLVLQGLVSLATDGCAGAAPPVNETCEADAYLPIATSAPLIRAMVTAFFDVHLRGTGDGLASVIDPVIVQPD